MSIIAAVQTYIRTYEDLKADAPIWVNYLGNVPTSYSIVPLPTGGVVEAYVSGKSLRQFQFAFQSMESTADDLERLGNSGFFEALSDWFDDQTEAGTLPTLGAGQTPTEVKALGWAFLFEQGDSETGVYMIQCGLDYIQDAP